MDLQILTKIRLLDIHQDRSFNQSKSLLCSICFQPHQKDYSLHHQDIQPLPMNNLHVIKDYPL